MLVRVWRVRNGRTSLILSCLIGFLNVAPAASQQLKIEVQQGDNGDHRTNTRYSTDIVVVVKDELDRPVPGAQVVFTLPPPNVAGAVFVHGDRITEAFTDAEGKAKVAGLRANNIQGAFAIRATASFGGETVTRPITETNYPPPLVTRKRVAIVGGVCAAVLIPVFALRSTPPPKATVSAVGPAGPVGAP